MSRPSALYMECLLALPGILLTVGASMKIKFVDLAAQNTEIKSVAEALIDQIHSNSSYVGGQQVSAFESAFAEFIGVKHVIGTSSGTDALRLALLGLGIRPGDSVITTPMTFSAPL